MYEMVNSKNTFLDYEAIWLKRSCRYGLTVTHLDYWMCFMNLNYSKCKILDIDHLAGYHIYVFEGLVT